MGIKDNYFRLCFVLDPDKPYFKMLKIQDHERTRKSIKNIRETARQG
jgi:hypothetical protein